MWWRSSPARPRCCMSTCTWSHEVTSPQAFDGLARARAQSPAPGSDHRHHGSFDADYAARAADSGHRSPRHKSISWKAIARISASAAMGLSSDQQGIVHIIGPEQGLTQPGMTVVCGDSHTATHGAFGALAFGIGTSEVEHVLATQCLLQTAFENLCGARGRRAQTGRHGERHHSGSDLENRHRRGNGLRDRISRIGDSRRCRWKSA